MTRRSVQRTAAAEAALRESEERMRLVANNVPALISYVDREQRYRFSNRTYDDWFGIAHEEHARPHRRRGIRRGGLRAHARQDIERCLAGEEVEFELTTARAAGAARCRSPACRTSAPEGGSARLLHAGQRRHRAQARAGGPALRRAAAAARRAAPGVPRPPRHAHRAAQPRDVRRPRARGRGARARGTTRPRRSCSSTWTTSSR